MNRRLATVKVCLENLCELLKTSKNGFRVIGNGLPEDAEVVGYVNDPRTRSIDLQIESATFEPITLGSVPPPLPGVIFETVRKELWFCGNIRGGTVDIIWGFCGIFMSRTEAINACDSTLHFIAPVTVGEKLPVYVDDIKDAEFPVE